MSNHFRSRSSRYNRSKGPSPKHQDRRSSSGRNNHSQSILEKLHKDYKPTFKLDFQWEPEDYYKIKIPYPHIPNEKETVQFPMLSEGTELGDPRAVFYNAIVDIQEQVEFDGTNGPLLYYSFNRCLKGTALNEWKEIVGFFL